MKTTQHSDNQEATRVAIACQGGGSHTAFSAGVLTRLLSDLPDSHTITGFSGTSGGAICATAAWYGFLSEAHDPGELLEAIWTDISASNLVDKWVNESLVASRQLRNAGGSVPAVSPYTAHAPDQGRRRLRDVLTKHIDFKDFSSLKETTNPPPPQLVLGTVNVITGALETFALPEVTPETILASAALPTLFQAVEINDQTYWDGVFAMNPPIIELVLGQEPQPDELWIVQVNPTSYPEEPTSLSDIYQRMNELTANLSLQQQRRFIGLLNQWATKGVLSDSEYTPTTVRTISLPRSSIESMKIDRRPSIIHKLLEIGSDEAIKFLENIDSKQSDIPHPC